MPELQPVAWQPEISAEAVEFTQPEIMAKLIATIDPNGYPHLTMISSNRALSPSVVKWGEFTRGMSKHNVKNNPKQGVLYMTAVAPFKFLQAKIALDHISREGDDAADFNMQHLFRYNTYMRVYTTYFNKVVAAGPVRDISLMGIVQGIVWNILHSPQKTGSFEQRLSPLGMKLFTGPVCPKFISYLDADGYPVIFPIFQARAVEGKQIQIPLLQFKNDILAITEGAKVSIFAMDMETVSQMIKGKFLGIQNKRGIVDVEWVYNSMPPKMGVLYPIRDSRSKVNEFI